MPPVAIESLPVVTAALTIPPAERADRSILPEEAMPVKPEAAPAAVTSQTLESMVTFSPLSPRVTRPLASKVPLAVKVPVEVKPEVAVIKPEMVGVAVQAVPVTVKLPPKEVKLLPETVNVLSKVVAPWRVKVPGVVVEPMTLTEEALVPMLVLPEEDRVVNAAVPGVVLPIPNGAPQVARCKEEALIVPVEV